MSYQTQLTNKTPFAAEKFVLADGEGQEVILVVVAASFERSSTASLDLAEVQCPVRGADEYNGDPAVSSVRHEADLALAKPRVDVLLSGHAHAPHGRAAQQVHVHLSIGDVRKDVIVSGDRYWRVGPFGASPSQAEYFSKLPLVYERAYGGVAADGAETRNPVGVGFRGARSRMPGIATEVANIEYPHDRIASKSDTPQPAGFGVVGRGWVPRLAYAGTFDQQWQERRWPSMPQDFDPQHYQSAPRDQQSRSLAGGEVVRLVNATPEGEWQFTLPRLSAPMLLFYNRSPIQASLRLDTVVIDADAYRVTLTSRVVIPVRRNHSPLREIVVGHVGRGWLRARTTGKKYIDYGGRGGARPATLLYQLQ